MPELANPVTGQIVTFNDEQAVQYRAAGWTDPHQEETVAEVKERVGDDVGLARTALEAERARSTPRSTLIAHLESVIDAE